MTDTISILSELRSNYNCFASVDEPYYQALTEAIAAIKAERKGHWIYSENEYGIDGYHCDKCNSFVPWDYKRKSINFIEDYHYCPNCGARMDGEQ